MSLTTSELDQYFRRIGFDGVARVDLDTLRRLHALQPQVLPFENLDAWLGRPVRLEPAAVFDKLVMQGRGGYCFEQNLLFRQVLETLGFRVKGLAARVLWNLPADAVLPRTHKLLLVELPGQACIADVGFGGLTLTCPLLLDSDEPQQSPHELLRLTRDPAGWLLHARLGAQWQTLYRFSLEEQQPADYTMANWFVSTHPQSRFVTQLIAGRADSGFRHALLDRRYTRHHLDGQSEQVWLESPGALHDVLEQKLMIDTRTIPELDERLGALFKEHN